MFQKVRFFFLLTVKSFGSEGRKKDGYGQQVPSSDKVYEYILFRGSDIKDLQVKSSPPVQTPPPIYNDPAIIQSQYIHPPSMSTSLPSAGSMPVTDPGSHTAQTGVLGSTFPGGLPLYQPGGSLGSWGSSPRPNANASGLDVPMYWQEFYPPSTGLSHVHQQSLLQPSPGLSMHHSMQQPMYSGISAPLSTGSNLPSSSVPAPSFPVTNMSAPNFSLWNMSSPNLTSSNMSAPYFPASNMSASNFTASNIIAPSFHAFSSREYSPPVLPPFSGGSINLVSSALQSTMLPSQPAAVASDVLPSPVSNMVSSVGPSTTSLSAYLPSSLDIHAVTHPTLETAPMLSVPYQTKPHYVSPMLGTFNYSQSETSTTSLVTPGQLLQPGPTSISSPVSLDPAKKDVEAVQVESSKPLPSAPVTTQAPILPLPSPTDQKLNGPPFTHHNRTNRGHERGRRSRISRPVTTFTEEFDFTAMNEKFKKDEVWGDLGKANKESDSKQDDGDVSYNSDNLGSVKLEKPVYVKDDFFDSISCTALENGRWNGRTKFSELRKLDSETFGDFPRHRGGRGGRWPGRGGRQQGSYYGRGYGYVGRGRGFN
ncbi:hypothetical protein IFM89_030739 [Coptis chinensis]|uniref:Protein decapping 5 n=1 Tax=Coptis chinensis TaxID=261450 RepID=A0A835IXT9_9MAGN|nr:hypothetical protein IFM89_030739 [Coptis chinensis]